MTKRNKTLSLIAIGAVSSLILIVVGGGILIDWWLEMPEPPPFRIVSSSPQQTYAITVERKQRESTREDWTSWKIYLSYTSQGQSVLNEVVVAAGDFSTGPYLQGKSPVELDLRKYFQIERYRIFAGIQKQRFAYTQ